MRCNNCGWDNPAGLSKCEKCGSPLSSEKAPSDQRGVECAAGTAMEAPAPELAKTVRESGVFGGAAAPAAPAEAAGAADGRCPECGYPLRPGVSMCPKCHHMLGHNESVAAKIGGNNVDRTGDPAPRTTQREAAGAGRVPTGREMPKNPTNFGGTVMPGMNITPDIWFSLTPLAIQGERETPGKADFEGPHHELNRENLDPKNHTITSKVQAVMDFDAEKKKWYIQDKSAMQYTFLNCNGEVPIVDGDVVLMGDRKFIFKAEPSQAAAEPQQFTGTIAVGRQRVNAPRCVLTPVVDEGEMDAPKEHMFRGDVHQLNRANLDPENHTITSHVQAELVCRDGQWYIKDCSQLRTTYLLCQDPMDLKDGDRILMGNRIFTFNC